MIVGISGFGSTGSGAVMDLLREYDDVTCGKNVELSFLYDPDGILDLEYNLVKNPIRFYSGDAAIKKFKKSIFSYDSIKYIGRSMSIDTFKWITNEYISDLLVAQYEGALWGYDRRQVNKYEYFIKFWLGGKFLRVFDKLHIRQPVNYFNYRMYTPVHDDKFYDATRKYTSKLIKCMCQENGNIIAMDQPFPSNNPSVCFKFFDQPCKAIVVNRDPRDLYLVSKMNPFAWELRFTPTNTVEDFITYYRDQMSLIRFDEDVLYVQFEDLIYKYEEEVNRIADFLDISKHSKKKQFFDPKISIANTQMVLRFPKMKEDIAKIERELPEFLYPFDTSKADLSSKIWNFKK